MAERSASSATNSGKGGAAAAPSRGAPAGASFDVVIAGGGSAGAVLARRLSEDPTRHVLLLEAGVPYGPKDYPDVVRLQTMIGGDAAHDWGFMSEAEIGGRTLPLPRGKVLGGSSAINAGVAMRAPAADFALWARHGLPHWSHDDAIRYYRKSEFTTHGDDALHGRDGPWPIHQLADDETSEMQRAFVASCVAVGLPRTADSNGARPFGATPYPMNVRMGARLNTGMTYLSAEIRARPNLTIRGGALVDRIEIAAGRAVAVRLSDGERIAGGEIILSAGAYGSPAILLRSGIGPAADLEGLDIPVAADLPVGVGLQEHPFFMMSFAAAPERLGLDIPPVGAIVWAASGHADADDHDIQISAVHYGDPTDSPTGAIFKLGVAMVRPEARGYVRLRDRDPASAPRIFTNMLGTASDRARMVDGVLLARRIAAVGPMAEIVAAELIPGPAAADRAAIERALPATLEPFHHPASTARMGSDDDPTAVTDWQGRVRGVAGLRVVDASLLPTVPSTASNPTVIMVAERIADLVQAG